MRWRSRAKPARPYICLLIILVLVLTPGAGPRLRCGAVWPTIRGRPLLLPRRDRLDLYEVAMKAPLCVKRGARSGRCRGVHPDLICTPRLRVSEEPRSTRGGVYRTGA